MKKPLADQIAIAKAKKDALAAKLAKLEAKAKEAEKRSMTRRQMIVGDAILSMMAQEPALRKFMGEFLNKQVTREADREAIADLLIP